MMPQVPNTSGPLVSVPETALPEIGSRCPVSAAYCLTKGRFQKNYFRKTSPGRVEMRIRRKTNRINPNRNLAWLR